MKTTKNWLKVILTIIDANTHKQTIKHNNITTYTFKNDWAGFPDNRAGSWSQPIRLFSLNTHNALGTQTNSSLYELTRRGDCPTSTVLGPSIENIAYTQTYRTDSRSIRL